MRRLSNLPAPMSLCGKHRRKSREKLTLYQGNWDQHQVQQELCVWHAKLQSLTCCCQMRLRLVVDFTQQSRTHSTEGLAQSYIRLTRGAQSIAQCLRIDLQTSKQVASQTFFFSVESCSFFWGGREVFFFTPTDFQVYSGVRTEENEHLKPRAALFTCLRTVWCVCLWKKLTAPKRLLPFIMSTNCSAISMATLDWASFVLAPKCGVLLTRGWSINSFFGFGSCVKKNAC